MTKKEKIKYLEGKIRHLPLKDKDRDVKRENIAQEIKKLKGWIK